LNCLILGWSIGTGSTGVYASELAQYLCDAGHQVTCLSAGGSDWRLRPYLFVRQQHPFEIVELRNPPIVPCTRPADPRNEIDSPETLILLRQVLAHAAPEVVAILDYPGWPARTVDICHEVGSKVFVYLQNMWPFCSRLSLMDRWGKICRDYEGGRRCVPCMENVVSSGAAKWRARLPAALWKSSHIHRAVKQAYQASIPRARHEEVAACEPAYGLRRRAYAEAISKADCVCYISQRTRELAEEFGVKCSRSLIAPVRLSHIQRVHAESAAHRISRPRPQDRIRFGYLGANSPEKGIETLLDAFGGLAHAAATLACHGGGSAAYMAQLKRIANAHPGVTFHGAYRQHQLSSLLFDIDVGIVPSICEDTAPNTVLEFQAAGIPVIGSRIGGIPEQIEDGRNGLLFEAGNVISLRQCMQRVMDSPQLVSEWAANLPSSFDPEPSWRQIERVLCELAGQAARGG
jgi:glycosyltransferase involved in cell wall biosynthesis